MGVAPQKKRMTARSMSAIPKEEITTTIGLAERIGL